MNNTFSMTPTERRLAKYARYRASEKGKSLGEEFERMTRFGSVTPDLWMVNATGSPVSAGPLLRAAEKALAEEEEKAGR